MFILRIDENVRLLNFKCNGDVIFFLSHCTLLSIYKRKVAVLGSVSFNGGYYNQAPIR